jgi:peptidoglycan/LPS O-acetylase OafA/YrhL
MKNFDYHLSINDTFLIKGIAICLMLWHHLFYLNPEYGTFVFQLGLLGKVCVALFLFVSAYGLTIQYGKTDDKSALAIFQFQAKRFVKFYANYWFIFCVFVPLGVFLFGRSLQEAYGNTNIIKSLLFDFIGINGFQSYNATWWFNQLIICTIFIIKIGVCSFGRITCIIYMGRFCPVAS